LIFRLPEDVCGFADYNGFGEVLKDGSGSLSRSGSKQKTWTRRTGLSGRGYSVHEDVAPYGKINFDPDPDLDSDPDIKNCSKLPG
jgi:hypothetical protein